jgi:glycosyltransferase involved in cell wall biosynthesis
MNIVHITPSVGPLSYGLGQVVLNLAKAQIHSGHNVKIWCLDSIKESEALEISFGLPEKCIRCFKPFGSKKFAFSMEMLLCLKQEGKNVDIVHQHGIWTFPSVISSILVGKYSCKLVIAPHGMLEQTDLNKSKIKKFVASLLYEKNNFKNASCFHATAKNEVVAFEKYGLKNKIALISNGISEEWLKMEGNPDRFYQDCNIDKKSKILLFMSRIAPKKGLSLLFEAWSKIEDKKNWIITVVGDDKCEYAGEMKTLAGTLNIKETVQFVGTAFGQKKRDAFAAASLFILPSYSEGFPMVVLDSLGAGVPVIVTKAAEWSDLEKYMCGWWVDIDAVAIQKAIMEAINLKEEKLVQMGIAGKKMVEKLYSWNEIGKQTIELYKELMNSK